MIGVRKEVFGSINFFIYHYVRMRRGTDESAIESMAEAADPIAINLKADSSSNHNDTKKKETHQ